MNLEGKIAISAFCLFLIFGVQGLFSIGEFTVPYFFDKIACFLISVVFLLINLRLKKWYYLLGYMLILVGLVLIDSFTILQVSEYTKSTVLLEIADNPITLWASFIGYYLFFLVLIGEFFGTFGTKIQAGILLLLWAASILLLVYQLYHIQFIVQSVFMLAYFFFNQRTEVPTKTFRDVIAVQLVLFVALHSLKYFV